MAGSLPLTRRGEIARAIAVGALIGFTAALTWRALTGNWTTTATQLLNIVFGTFALGLAYWCLRTAWLDELERRRRQRTVQQLRRLTRDRGGL